MRSSSIKGFIVSAACLTAGMVFQGPALAVSTGIAARPLITQSINESDLIELSGNLRPEAIPANDRNKVDDDLLLEHMQLLLKRSPEREAALETLIDGMHDTHSAEFHQWLTAEKFGTEFGASATDVAIISKWLKGHGLTVNTVLTNQMVIDFSGTAKQVSEAFHTEIHNLSVDGVSHIANMSSPKIPEALSHAVAGVVSLHDFKPRAMNKPKAGYTFTGSNGTYEAVVPADLATIYNLNPLFSKGYTGAGQTIVVIEDTDVYSVSDWTTFRSTFGLSSYTSGSFTQVHPAPKSGTNNCTDPGDVTGNDAEAILDAEWSSAAAPSAAIELASCKDTTTFGGLIALQNLINQSSTPPAIVSISYGECEAANGATANAAFVSTYQQAVAEGVSVFVSSGDEGAASCDADRTVATHGIAVSGFASTPYNVAVGGTDFGDTYAKTNSTYWGATNSATYGSALSYIPEIPWNDSCASTLLVSYEGYSTPYGSAGLCNASMSQGQLVLSTASGSGGPSGCATGAPAKSDVVSGTCAGTAKPSWQSGILGNPADSVRDIPDVSLFAANGIWGHYYVFCYTNPSGGGDACTGAPSTWNGAGGTSFASPILAAMQALVNQYTGVRWGNPAPTYYSLAKTAYGTSGQAACNSTSGKSASSACVFYDTTQGDMDVNCLGAIDCFRPSGANGVLSTTSANYSPSYKTGTGWDFATGIGSVNAYNLVMAWPKTQ